MKRLRMILALTVAATIALAGCGQRAVVQPTVVCATIKPIALIVQAIAGSALQVRVLANADGTPLQNAHELASESAVVFQTGMLIDAWSGKIVPESVRLVSLSVASDSSTQGSPWLSLQYATDMARAVRDTLETAYPGMKDQFDSRYAAFLSESSQADGQLKKLIWNAHTRAFLAEDATWSPAAGDFGLRIVVRPGLKGLDLAGTEAAVRVKEWGSGDKTMVVVINVDAGENTGIDRQANGIVVCRLDASGATAQGDFVSWLEHQLETLGSAMAG